MKRFILAMLVALLPAVATACNLTWVYNGEPAWLEGFRVYQKAVAVGTAAPADRQGVCTDLGIVPLSGPVTMTAYSNTNESPQSEPAHIVLSAPSGLTIQVGL